MKGPRVTFKTLIYHPNIGDDGRICTHFIRTDQGWYSTMRIEDILTLLAKLINWSDLNNALNGHLAFGIYI